VAEGGSRCREAGKRVEKQDERVKKQFWSSTREKLMRFKREKKGGRVTARKGENEREIWGERRTYATLPAALLQFARNILLSYTLLVLFSTIILVVLCVNKHITASSHKTITYMISSIFTGFCKKIDISTAYHMMEERG
jgi:hypothetical protein